MARGKRAQPNRKSRKPFDGQERDRLVLENLAEVGFIARRIHNRIPLNIELEDLMDSGIVGLLEAIDHYDPRRHIKLMTFAKLRIQGAMLDSLRDLDWSPRDLRRKARQVEDALHRLRAKMGRPPGQDELAAEMGMTVESLHDLVCELRGLDLESLENLSAQREPTQQAYRSSSSSGEDPATKCMEAEFRSLLARAVSELPARDREVIGLYYVEELTMREIGEHLGLGEGRISQIHAAALNRLRSRLLELLAPSMPPLMTPVQPCDPYMPEWTALTGRLTAA